MHYIVVVGTLASGFEFHGPFTTQEAAEKWCEQMEGGKCEIVPLLEP